MVLAYPPPERRPEVPSGFLHSYPGGAYFRFGSHVQMLSIAPFLDEEAAFDPQDLAAMSRALDDVCEALKLSASESAREIIAIRILELAQSGEKSPTRLRDRLLEEANSGSGC